MQSRIVAAARPGSVVIAAMGRGTGKTFVGKTLAHKLAFERPGIHIGLLMPSLKQARMVFWPHLEDDYRGPLKWWCRMNKSELSATYSNGSRLTTWGAENAHSIRGQRFGAVIEDECDDIDTAVETAVVQPTFSRSGRSAIWYKSGTPRRGRQGILYRDFELGRKGHATAGLRYVSFKYPSSASPQVDQVWLDAVRMTTDPAIYSREYDVDFDSGEGLVFVFDEDFHVREAPPVERWSHEFSRFVVGVDHGMVDPGVMILAGIRGHGRDASVHLLREWYEVGVMPEQWDARARDWSFADTFFCDPSRPDRIKELRQRGGVNAIGADNSIFAGISQIANLLHRRTHDHVPDYARMYVDPSLKNTIRELKTYRRKRDPHAADAFLESPLDKDNHAPDAIRYLVLGVFGRGDAQRVIVPGR